MATLNAWADVAIPSALSVLWQSAILIGLLYLLDLVLRYRARACVRHALWLLVLLKLFLPPSLAVPTGFGYWLRSQALPAPAPERAFAAAVTTVPGSASTSLPTGVSEPAPLRLSARAFLLLAWACGTAGLLSLLLYRSHCVVRLVRGGDLAPQNLQALADGCARRLGLPDPLPLRLSPLVQSPAVCGLRSPVLLLPRNLAKALSDEQLRAVILHELFHVKRHDVWMNCAQSMAQIVYWWHPLLWLANTRIRQTREEAVDEAVMVELGPKADVYPAMLLEVAKTVLRRPTSGLALIGIFESRKALKHRIRRLLEWPIPRRAHLTPAALLGIVLAGALLLPMAQGKPAVAPSMSSIPRAAQVVPDAQQRSVLLDCRLIKLADSALQRLALGLPHQRDASREAWILSEEQTTRLVDQMTREAECEVVARPRVVVNDGVQGTISVTRAMEVDGRTVYLGPVVDLTPHIQHNWVDVDVSAVLTEHDPESATGINERQLTVDAISVPQDGAALVLDPQTDEADQRHLAILVKVQPDWTVADLTEGNPTSVSGVPENLPDDLRTRIYALDEETIRYNLPRTSPWTDLSLDAVLRRWLAEAGIVLTPPAELMVGATGEIDRAASVVVAPHPRLFVRSSENDQARIAQSLEPLMRSIPQVLIEARFIEAPRDFATTITLGQPVPTLDGLEQIRILDERQLTAFLEATEPTPGIDVMGAPRVTTLSGRQTQIQIVEIRHLPKAVTAPSAQAPSDPGRPDSKTAEIAVEPIPLGPTLDLVPTVRADGSTIDLLALFSVLDLVETGNGSESSGGGVPEQGSRVRARTLQGRATLLPGETLLVGGPGTRSLQAAAQDSVTVLGDSPLIDRLDQPDQSIDPDRYLVVLITPMIVDPAGNPVHGP